MAVNKRNLLKKILCFVLVFALAMCVFIVNNSHTAMSAPKTIRLKQVKNLALANSSSYKSTKNKIALKEVSYKQAVKSLKLKKKNMSTFRWTPLLSFKFPEKADLVEESEFIYKPMQIQNEITELEHKLDDEIYSTYEKAANLYTEVYGYQETVTFQEEQLEELKKTLQRNENRYKLGLATSNDIETIKKSIDNLENKLASNMKKFEKSKEKLSDLIGLDVISGYTFVNPYTEANIPRSKLNEIINYTLANDHDYYSAKMDTSLALLLLDTNYDLMKRQYGGKISYISSFVSQIQNGDKVDGSAFKLAYDEFLTAIDKPWQGKKRILFIRIPKEWFKGQIDGVRYVEDEPYALYEAALEYMDVLQTQKDVEKELTNQVKDDYETLIATRTSYNNLEKQLISAEENLNRMSILNSLGDCTFEEYTDAKTEYEELQMEAMEALQLYTTLLYSYDRLTCGAITKYLSGDDIDIESAGGGNSYIVEENTETAMYYINTIIEDNMFEFGIYIPDDFETDITHYELWADGYQIGTRTEIDRTIRHLMISTKDVEKFTVRVYDGETFVDDCKIDTQVYQGELKIITGYTISDNKQEQSIGTYTVSPTGNDAMVSINLNIKPEKHIVYYTLQNADGKYIFSEEPVYITEGFKYLSFISGNMDNLIIRCYDENKLFLYEAEFRSDDYSIYKK